MRMALLGIVLVVVTSGMRAFDSRQALPSNPGRAAFERACARCHGDDGQGGEMGPGITTRIPLRTDQELSALVRDGLPAKGMPPSRLAEDELRPLLAFVRTLAPPRSEAPARVSVEISGGAPLSGFLLNRSADDMQVLGEDGTLRLLRRDGPRHRLVTSQVDWPTYHGAPHGNRYSPVDQINRATVERLAPAWIFTLPDAASPARSFDRGRLKCQMSRPEPASSA